MRQTDTRGKPQAQPDFLTGVNLNQCVPADHPLRAIKRRRDAVLQKLSRLFDELYTEEGCPSVESPPPGGENKMHGQKTDGARRARRLAGDSAGMVFLLWDAEN